jgi:sugar phosphate isomerase/epimerase
VNDRGLFFGYNTNGFAHHKIDDIIPILSDLGYHGIALTIDYHVINPFEPGWRQEAERVRGLLARHDMRCVVETGSRFLLDSRRKHQPTLVSRSETEREVRLRFLEQCIEIAEILRADCVSFWSGTQDDDADQEVVGRRLVDGCRRLIEFAQRRSVKLAFEPEPGMLVDSMWQYFVLTSQLNDTDVEDFMGKTFGLTIDINHLQCSETPPISRWIDGGSVESYPHRVLNIHISDGRHGVHDHLMFGEGEIEFAPVFQALKNISYTGGVYVELSRHSHDAVRVAERSLRFLNELVARGGWTAD